MTFSREAGGNRDSVPHLTQKDTNFNFGSTDPHTMITVSSQFNNPNAAAKKISGYPSNKFVEEAYPSCEVAKTRLKSLDSVWPKTYYGDKYIKETALTLVPQEISTSIPTGNVISSFLPYTSAPVPTGEEAVIIFSVEASLQP